MSRRPLALLALAITSVVLAACSDISAPRRDDPESCPNGTWTTSGFVCNP
jgi:hypothetical protein